MCSFCSDSCVVLYFYFFQSMSDDGEDGPTLPRAGLNKIIKEVLPTIRVANESRDLLYNCCIEFIRLISKHANDLCNVDQRKTISHEHVLKALENLGFGPEYVDAAGSVLNNCREAAQRRLQRQSSRLENLGIPEEELLRQQQELFERARMQQFEVEQSQIRELHNLLSMQQQQQQQFAQPFHNGQTMTAGIPCMNISGQQQPPLASAINDSLDEDYDA